MVMRLLPLTRNTARRADSGRTIGRASYRVALGFSRDGRTRAVFVAGNEMFQDGARRRRGNHLWHSRVSSSRFDVTRNVSHTASFRAFATHSAAGCGSLSLWPIKLIVPI